MQDGDHTDGHYITLFAEQLTRTFEVLVIPGKNIHINIQYNTHTSKQYLLYNCFLSLDRTGDRTHSFTMNK